MATTLPGPATLPRESYLNSEHGLKSWLLTQDHKRIAILYIFSMVFFFVIGGVAASLIRLELLTPAGDLVSSDTYNKVFSAHGIIMVFLFLVPMPAIFGNFLIPLMIGARDVAFPDSTWRVGTCSSSAVCSTLGVDLWRHRYRMDVYYTDSATYLNTHVTRRSSACSLRASLPSHWAQFRRHDSQVARARHDVVPAAAVRVVDVCDISSLFSPLPSSPSPCLRRA